MTDETCKEEVECQTYLQCTPHLLREGDNVVVQSVSIVQTCISLTPNDSNTELFGPLSYTKPSKIREDAVGEIVAKRKGKLHFLLPDEEEEEESGDEEIIEDTKIVTDVKEEQIEPKEQAPEPKEQPPEIKNSPVKEIKTQKDNPEEEGEDEDENKGEYEGEDEGENEGEEDDENDTKNEAKPAEVPKEETKVEQFSDGEVEKVTNFENVEEVKKVAEKTSETSKCSETKSLGPILKKRFVAIRRENVEDSECQTILMVAPHFVADDEKAVIYSNFSIQTSITFNPESSLTDIIPKLKSYLVHDTCSVSSTGDNAENKSIIDIIRGIIEDVENCHAHLFDPDYKPPEVPPELAGLEGEDLKNMINTSMSQVQSTESGDQFFSSIIDQLIDKAAESETEDEILEKKQCWCKFSAFKINIKINNIAGEMSPDTPQITVCQEPVTTLEVNVSPGTQSVDIKPYAVNKYEVIVRPETKKKHQCRAVMYQAEQIAKERAAAEGITDEITIDKTSEEEEEAQPGAEETEDVETVELQEAEPVEATEEVGESAEVTEKQPAEEASTEEASAEEVPTEEISEEAKPAELSEEAPTEPAAEEAKAEEPSEETPSEPAAEEASAEEAPTEEISEEAKPAEPSEEAPTEPADEEAKAEEPSEETPSEPAAEEASAEEAPTEEISEEAKPAEPSEEAPTEPADEEAKAEEPSEETPSEPAAEEAKAEEPSEETPSEPAAEEAKTEEIPAEPVGEEAKAEEPSAEEPKVEKAAKSRCNCKAVLQQMALEKKKEEEKLGGENVDDEPAAEEAKTKELSEETPSEPAAEEAKTEEMPTEAIDEKAKVEEPSTEEPKVEKAVKSRWNCKAVLQQMALEKKKQEEKLAGENVDDKPEPVKPEEVKEQTEEDKKDEVEAEEAKKDDVEEGPTKEDSDVEKVQEDQPKAEETVGKDEIAAGEVVQDVMMQLVEDSEKKSEAEQEEKPLPKSLSHLCAATLYKNALENEYDLVDIKFKGARTKSEPITSPRAGMSCCKLQKPSCKSKTAVKSKSLKFDLDLPSEDSDTKTKGTCCKSREDAGSRPAVPRVCKCKSAQRVKPPTPSESLAPGKSCPAFRKLSKIPPVENVANLPPKIVCKCRKFTSLPPPPPIKTGVSNQMQYSVQCAPGSEIPIIPQADSCGVITIPVKLILSVKDLRCQTCRSVATQDEQQEEDVALEAAIPREKLLFESCGRKGYFEPYMDELHDETESSETLKPKAKESMVYNTFPSDNYVEPYSVDGYCASHENTEVQTDLALGPKILSTSLKSVSDDEYETCSEGINSARTCCSHKNESPWNVVALPPKGTIRITPMEQKAFDSNEDFESILRALEKEYNPELLAQKTSFLYDKMDGSEAEPYSEGLLREYPDEETSDSPCSSHTEMPWKSLLIPMNIKIRKVPKPTKPCPCKSEKSGKGPTGSIETYHRHKVEYPSSSATKKAPTCKGSSGTMNIVSFTENSYASSRCIPVSDNTSSAFVSIVNPETGSGRSKNVCTGGTSSLERSTIKTKTSSKVLNQNSKMSTKVSFGYKKPQTSYKNTVKLTGSKSSPIVPADERKVHKILSKCSCESIKPKPPQKEICDPCKMPLDTNGSSSSLVLKPDPVMLAMKACEEELRPIKLGLNAVQEKLRNLNMPELDCLFNNDLTCSAKDDVKSIFRYRSSGPQTVKTKLKFDFSQNRFSNLQANESSRICPATSYYQKPSTSKYSQKYDRQYPPSSSRRGYAGSSYPSHISCPFSGQNSLPSSTCSRVNPSRDSAMSSSSNCPYRQHSRKMPPCHHRSDSRSSRRHRRKEDKDWRQDNSSCYLPCVDDYIPCSTAKHSSSTKYRPAAKYSSSAKYSGSSRDRSSGPSDISECVSSCSSPKVVSSKVRRVPKGKKKTASQVTFSSSGNSQCPFLEAMKSIMLLDSESKKTSKNFFNCQRLKSENIEQIRLHLRLKSNNSCKRKK